MECTTEWEKGYRQWGRAAHRVALVGLVILIVIGIRLESVEGLVACGPPFGLDSDLCYNLTDGGRSGKWRESQRVALGCAGDTGAVDRQQPGLHHCLGSDA